jgi:phytoene synthase
VRSATDRSIVPKNSEEIFVLVPLGAGTTYSQAELDVFTEKVLDRVEKVVGTKFRQHLVVKKVYTPQDFAQDYNAFQGTALGLAHTLSQSLFFRPKNKSDKVEGLYYAGQYTNPGVGVPMALVSAEIVAGMINNQKEVEADLNQIFMRGSTTYYYSSLFFTGQVKKDVFTLYAYVRTVDDLVDIPQPLTKELDAIWAETLKSWSGQKSSNSIVQNFIALAQRQGFEWAWIEAFWQAMRSDLSKKKYSSYAELDTYMYGSAAVVGLMMAKILGLSPKAMTAASQQGKAMQFINFLRDVQEDKELGRNYLNISPAEERDQALWQSRMRQHIKHYWQLQCEAEKGYRYIPKKYLIPIKTASDMYAWTAQKIFENPSLVWQKKIKPSKMRVISQILKNGILLR